MEKISFSGEFIQVNGIELDVVHGEENLVMYHYDWGDRRSDDAANREISDGAVLNYCVPPEYNIRALELLDAGAKKAGRRVDDIDRPKLIVCSVDLDHERAIDTTRGLLTQLSGTTTPYCQGIWC